MQPRHDGRRRFARQAGLFVLAWLPFYFAWGLLNFAYFDVGLARAFEGAAYAIGSAGTLALAVWWLSGRLEWPEGLRPGFYAIHLGLGAAYSAVWILFGASVTAFQSGGAVWDAVRHSPSVGWRFLTGLWLYGLVAGVSYALRIRRGLQREREAALAAAALAATARLEALRSQLDPHFLFNALHSLGELIETDPAQAQLAVERLGALLRYSLDHSGPEVSLEREWAFTRDYLELESLRYEDRLRWEASLSDAVAPARVPTFCLQIPVENAVRHAVAVRREGATVRLTAAADGNHLALRVEDDGPGAAAGALDAPGGSGLRLLRDRLAALYGDAAELRVDSAPGRGFAVDMRLPLRLAPTGGAHRGRAVVPVGAGRTG